MKRYLVADRKAGHRLPPGRVGTVPLGRTWCVSSFVMGVVAVMACWPVHVGSKEELFEIPEGTWTRRMAGDKVDILPRTIYLTLGVNDVLLLRNRDKVPQMFGPVLIMPGQDFRLPFEQAAHNQFDCTAHSTGQMTVIVDPEPTPGWPRLAWRAKSIYRFIVPA